MALYTGVVYNLTICLLQSRLKHIYHGQPYAKVDLNPMPELTLSPSQGLKIVASEDVLYVVKFGTATKCSIT